MKLTKKVKNQTIQFVVTDHAYQRFSQRIAKLHKGLLPYEIVKKFVEVFKESHKLKIRSFAKQIRDEKYEGRAIYYRNKDFNFIVLDNVIITVELNGDKKNLNRQKRPNRVTSRGTKNLSYSNVRKRNYNFFLESKTMTATMSQAIGSTKLNLAAKMAVKYNENVAIIASELNKEPVQMLFPVSVVEKSPNKDHVEVIAIIDKDGNFVD